MIANTLDHRDRATVSHAKPLARKAIDINLAARGAIKQRVARDDVFLGVKGNPCRRPDDDPTTRETLAHIIVRVAHEIERHARNEERAETLARGPREGDADGFIG